MKGRFRVIRTYDFDFNQLISVPFALASDSTALYNGGLGGRSREGRPMRGLESKPGFRRFLCSAAGFACYRLYISIFFVSNNVMPQLGRSPELMAYDAYSLLLALLVLVCVFVRNRRFFHSDAVCAAAAALMALGAVSYGLLSFGGMVLFFWPFVLCSGVGVALGTVQWGFVLGSEAADRNTAAVIAGFLLAAVLNTGVGLFSTAYIVAAAFAGPTSCLFLGLLHRMPEGASEGADEGSRGADARFVLKASAAFLLFSVASVFCSMPMEFSVIGTADAPHGVLPLLRTCVTAVLCLIAFGLMVAAPFSLRALYRLIPLFLVVGGLSLFLRDMLPVFAYVCALVGRLGLQLMFWVFAPRIAHCSKMATGRAFAMEFSLYWLGYAGSLYLVRELWPDPYTASLDAMGGIVVAAVVMLTAAYLFVFPEHDLCEATDSGVEAAESGSTAADSLPYTEAAQQALAALARQHGLSPRETEVFLLLAHGRDTAYIQKTLFISSGTVSSHRRRIYQKLGVHSKQELLDIVEHAGI